MPRISGTLGQLLVNEELPIELRDYNRVMDKKTLSDVLSRLAKTYPDKYKAVTYRLNQLGQEFATYTGGNSPSLVAMTKAKAAKARREKLQEEVDKILDDDTLSDEDRDNAFIRLAGPIQSTERQEILKESLAEKNPFALQLQGAGRGNPMNLASLRGSDGLYQDHRGRTIPVPVLRSYAEGLTPLEYWAGTYGARQSVIAVKFSTADAGYLAKQLNQVSHRNLVTALDRDDDPPTLVGLPVDVNDNDSEGSLLAADTGGYPRNTVLTPKILADIRNKGVKRILVRSPAVSGSPDGGVYARDVGVREFGRLPEAGENVGMVAAQAIGEPVSQGMLNTKHGGGVAGETKTVGGFDYINQLIQAPKKFKHGATHSELDGIVTNIAPAPAGGNYVTINNKQHYVPTGMGLLVKKNDTVEAGDVLSEGIPNPAIITQHKGLGEGRRYFIKTFLEATKASGINAHRRNVELLSKGLINHVRLTDEIGDFAPDDVVPYSTLEHSYRPRDGFRSVPYRSAVGKYLERPYLHYSIGTKVRPSMLKDFEEFKVNTVDIHDDPPPFEAEMIRGSANLHHDPDWQTRMFGSGLKGSLLDAVHRGGTSDEEGTSFVPSRIKAVNFGTSGKVISPKRDFVGSVLK